MSSLFEYRNNIIPAHLDLLESVKAISRTKHMVILIPYNQNSFYVFFFRVQAIMFTRKIIVVFAVTFLFNNVCLIIVFYLNV